VWEDQTSRRATVQPPIWSDPTRASAVRMTTTTLIPITDRNLPQDRYRKVTILGTIVPRRTRRYVHGWRCAPRSLAAANGRLQNVESSPPLLHFCQERAPSIIGTGENLAARSGPSARVQLRRPLSRLAACRAATTSSPVD
jgi:hypothetical protein